MHEMTICSEILQILENQSKKQHFSRINHLWLEIGALSCIESEALAFNFEVVKVNTIAHEAKLHIESVAAQAKCMSCNKCVEIFQFAQPCPECGTDFLQILNGKQMKIKRIEVS